MATAIATPYTYSPSPATKQSSLRTNILLWTAQDCWPMFFAGGMKLITPLAALEQRRKCPGCSAVHRNLRAARRAG